MTTRRATLSDGSIWVGTSWMGIARLRPGLGWMHYGAAAGLASDTVAALAVDARTSPRTLSIASDRGLSSSYTGTGD